MSVVRVGLLGGSFDPIHKGHLALAKAILKDGCQEVWFLPCIQSPLKERQLTDFEDRCKMIQLAIKPYRKMKLCTIEKDLPTPSFTVQTLKKLKSIYSYEFVFYIGNDQAMQLEKWKNFETCMQLAQFRVFKRDSDTIQSPYPLKEVTFQRSDISSTKIRKGCFFDVPKSVRRYIWEHRLYLDEFVCSSMSSKRYQHSKSVAEVCQKLARAHHLNERDAYVIGLLHDVCKEWKIEKSEAWMKCFEPEHLLEPKPIWHGYLVDHYLKRMFPVREKHILTAVHDHVLGNSSNPYAKIIFIADKCDPLRGYDVSEQLALSEISLQKGFERVKKEQQEYLNKGEKHE